MNKKLRALLDSINAKKQEVQDLAEAGKLTEAQDAKDELQQLQQKLHHGHLEVILVEVYVNQLLYVEL